MFIVFEGTDGTGKTTTAKYVASCLGAQYYATPPKAFAAKREEIDQHATADDHYRFYLDGIRLASREIGEVLEKGETVISDRYWVTTYIYHLVRRAQVSQKDFAGIVLPDLTVLLTVAPAVRAARLERRGMSTDDRRMLDKQEILSQEFVRFLNEEEKNLLVIDTSFITPDQVAAKVVTRVRELNRG